MSAETAVRVHYIAAAVWLVLALVTTGFAIFFPDNSFLLAWIIFMSGYANVSTHLSAAAGAGPSEEND